MRAGAGHLGSLVGWLVGWLVGPWLIGDGGPETERAADPAPVREDDDWDRSGRERGRVGGRGG